MSTNPFFRLKGAQINRVTRLVILGNPNAMAYGFATNKFMIQIVFAGKQVTPKGEGDE